MPVFEQLLFEIPHAKSPSVRYLEFVASLRPLPAPAFVLQSQCFLKIILPGLHGYDASRIWIVHV